MSIPGVTKAGTSSSSLAIVGLLESLLLSLMKKKEQKKNIELKIKSYEYHFNSIPSY